MAMGALFTYSLSFQILVLNHARITVHPYIVGDWLISYSSGFQRRGLGGSTILGVSDLIGASPVDLVAVVQISLFLGVMFLLFKWISSADLPFYAVAAVFSPVAIFYFLMDQYVVGRKEFLLYLVALIWLRFQSTVLTRKGDNRFLNLKLTAFALLFTCLLLVHEGLVFFLPLLLIPVLLAEGSNLSGPQTALKLFGTILIPSTLVSLTLFLFSVSSTKQELCTPLLERGISSDVCSGAIDWSTRNNEAGILFSLGEVLEIMPTYSLYLLMCVVALIPVTFFILTKSSTREKRKAVWWTVTLLFATAPVFLVALDWGRYISIIATLSSFVILRSVLDARREDFYESPTPGLTGRFVSNVVSPLVVFSLAAFWLLFGVWSYGGEYTSVLVNLFSQLPYYLSFNINLIR